MKKYLAFISYRHDKYDKAVASRLHRRLELFHLPSGNPYSKRKKLFRDEEELPTSSNLGDDIHSALSESEYLIVICSPRFPVSKWCRKEIEFFVADGRKDRILPVLIEGSEETSIPDIIKDIPAAADLRSNSVSPSEAPCQLQNLNKAIDRIVPSLLSRMTGIQEADIARAEFLHRLFWRGGIAIGIAGLLIGFAAYAKFTADRIRQNNAEIEAAAVMAENVRQTAEFERNNAILSTQKTVAFEAKKMLIAGEYNEAIRHLLQVISENDPDYPRVPEAMAVLRTAMSIPLASSLSEEKLADRFCDLVPFHSSEWFVFPGGWRCASVDGTAYFTQSLSAAIYKWDTATGELLWKCPAPPDNGGTAPPHTEFSADGKTIWRSYRNKTAIDRIDSDTGKILFTIDLNDNRGLSGNFITESMKSDIAVVSHNVGTHPANITHSTGKLITNGGSISYKEGLAIKIFVIDRSSGTLLWSMDGTQTEAEPEKLFFADISDNGNEICLLEWQEQHPETTLRYLVYDSETGREKSRKELQCLTVGAQICKVQKLEDMIDIVVRYNDDTNPHDEDLLWDPKTVSITGRIVSPLGMGGLNPGNNCFYLTKHESENTADWYYYSIVNDDGSIREPVSYDPNDFIKELIPEESLYSFGGRRVAVSGNTLYDFDTAEPLLYSDCFEVTPCNGAGCFHITNNISYSGMLYFRDDDTLIHRAYERLQEK